MRSKTKRGLPKLPWIKLDAEKHNWFKDGSRFLVALKVKNNTTGKTKWEFDIVRMDCDGEVASLYYEGDEIYDKWSWFDFEYFYLLEGAMPIAREDRHDW